MRVGRQVARGDSTRTRCPVPWWGRPPSLLLRRESYAPESVAMSMGRDGVFRSRAAPSCGQGMEKATAPAPAGSRVTPSTQEIRLRDTPANSCGDPTRGCEKQHRPSGSSQAVTPDRAASDSCRRSPTARRPVRPGFVPGRNHSGRTGRLRRFATALLIALAAVASGVPAFAQSPALTAQFENVPASHNGSAVFRVELRFSEEVNLSASAIRDNGLLTITGGTRHNQGRLVPGSSIGWRIDVKPGGNGDVTITLPASQEACNENSVAAQHIGRCAAARGSLGMRHHRFDVIEFARQPRGQTVRQQAEGGVALGAVPASDLRPARGLARVRCRGVPALRSRRDRQHPPCG